QTPGGNRGTTAEPGAGELKPGHLPAHDLPGRPRSVAGFGGKPAPVAGTADSVAGDGNRPGKAAYPSAGGRKGAGAADQSSDAIGSPACSGRKGSAPMPAGGTGCPAGAPSPAGGRGRNPAPGGTGRAAAHPACAVSSAKPVGSAATSGGESGDTGAGAAKRPTGIR